MYRSYRITQNLVKSDCQVMTEEYARAEKHRMQWLPPPAFPPSPPFVWPIKDKQEWYRKEEQTHRKCGPHSPWDSPEPLPSPGVLDPNPRVPAGILEQSLADFLKAGVLSKVTGEPGGSVRRDEGHWEGQAEAAMSRWTPAKAVPAGC